MQVYMHKLSNRFYYYNTMSVIMFCINVPNFTLFTIIRSTSLNDFWASMQTAWDENFSSYSYPPHNLTKIMYPWIRRNYYPILNVTRENDTTDRIEVKSKNTSETWFAPLAYTIGNFYFFEYISTPKFYTRGDLVLLSSRQTGKF